MEATPPIWQIWSDFLQRWGVDQWTASLLEAAGPLTLLGAQAIYLSQPLLNHALPQGQLETLAELFEDTEQVRAFAAYLREGSSPCI